MRARVPGTEHAMMPDILAIPYEEHNSPKWDKTLQKLPEHQSETYGHNIKAVRGKIHIFNDLDRYLEFQFNPTELNLTKRNRWEMLNNTGQMGVDPIWLGGDTRNVQFKLLIDKTYCSIYDYVGGHYSLDDTKSENTDNLVTWTNPRGVLPIIEMLESFQYPIGDFDTTWFKEAQKGATPLSANVGAGMISRTKQFIPPPDLVFVFGQYYLVCKMSELSIRHVLFNSELIPIRSEAEITLVIKENASTMVDTSIIVKGNGERRTV